jgi:YbgC/YbaW family acyl-CoA thioester hydrolase
MQRTDFRFFDRLRVRWAEIDAQHIVFNAHYLMYIDTAVAGYWRALAMPYHETMQQLQGDLYVRKATLEYEASARYDDQLHVGVRTARLGNSSMVLSAAVFRGQQRLVHGELVYVFADPATQKSKPIPPDLRALFEGYEAGGDVLRVQTGVWATLGDAARALRQQVFVDEQGIAAELVVDAADADAEHTVHAVAFNHFGMAVGTGRLVLKDAGTVARIGRMATHAGLRGAGIGERVLQALLSEARARGAQQAVLMAQTGAVAFYRRHGFTTHGAEFVEAGLPHQEMHLPLVAIA